MSHLIHPAVSRPGLCQISRGSGCGARDAPYRGFTSSIPKFKSKG